MSAGGIRHERNIVSVASKRHDFLSHSPKRGAHVVPLLIDRRGDRVTPVPHDDRNSVTAATTEVLSVEAEELLTAVRPGTPVNENNDRSAGTVVVVVVVVIMEYISVCVPSLQYSK